MKKILLLCLFLFVTIIGFSWCSFFYGFSFSFFSLPFTIHAARDGGRQNKCLPANQLPRPGGDASLLCGRSERFRGRRPPACAGKNRCRESDAKAMRRVGGRGWRERTHTYTYTHQNTRKHNRTHTHQNTHTFTFTLRRSLSLPEAERAAVSSPPPMVLPPTNTAGKKRVDTYALAR